MKPNVADRVVAYLGQIAPASADAYTIARAVHSGRQRTLSVLRTLDEQGRVRSHRVPGTRGGRVIVWTVHPPREVHA